MVRLVMLTSFLLVDPQTRDKLLETMDSISRYSLANEPGVYKYALLVPRNDSLGTEMYSLEEYENQDAFQSHLSEPPVAEMFDWVISSSIHASDPISRTLVHTSLDPDSETGLGFALHDAIDDAVDPLVVVTDALYDEDSMSGSEAAPELEYWGEVVEYLAESEGALAYWVFSDVDAEGEGAKAKGERVIVVGAYEDEEAWEVLGDGVDEHVATHLFLTLKGGFMDRPDS